jgi:two-component system sensor histidine kinase CpxA
MRSIFTKILLWTSATTAVSLIGFAATTRLIWQLQPGPIDPIVRFHVLLLDDARTTYKEGGPARLAAYLRRLDKRFDARHFLVDAGGRDMVDGTDRSALLAAGSTPPDPPRWRGDELVLVSASGGSRLLITIHPKFSPAGLLPYYLWIFLMIGALGYALAVYLARPLKNLRVAVERFGRGDLETRTGSTRRDEIGDLARAFDRMAERIGALMAAQKRLLQDVSHELRSPLARLQLTVRLARSSGARAASLDRVKKEVDRLTSLVGELIQVTAAEDDPRSLDRDEIRLDELIEELVTDVALEAEARGCQIGFTENDAVLVLGDRELLRRAVENVLRNAIRHAPDGTAIQIHSRRHEGTVAIAVRDFGSGVPDESLTRIFEPFYRVEDDRSRSGGGVGLGLAITRRAIALHGGVVSASNANPGLVVTIELPAATGDSESGGLAPPSEGRLRG